jgi:hypothetical protein
MENEGAGRLSWLNEQHRARVDRGLLHLKRSKVTDPKAVFEDAVG